MNTDFIFEFTADKANRTIHIKRTFNAPLDLVWAAFTQQEILDRWGAPAPWVAKTKYMNFEEGGRRLYAMVNPEGQQFWSVQDYTRITPKTNLHYISGFTDEEAHINPDFYGSQNELVFSETAGITTVHITIIYKTVEVLEMMVAKGFKEGTAATFINLDLWLAAK